jgi:hypothetical protein
MNRSIVLNFKPNTLMPQPIQVDPFERLREILLPEEAADLVDSFEAVINFRNGFGRVEVEIEYRRVKEVFHQASSKPKLRLKDQKEC